MISMIKSRCLLLLALFITGQGYTQSFKNLDIIEETVIGTTFYDLQTQASIPKRIFKSPNGSLSAVWMFSNYAPPSYIARGTGYNFFDQGSWQSYPLVRLESIRTGWPTTGVLGNGKEIIVSHNSKQIQISSRTTAGIGIWKEDSVSLKGTNPVISWPRMAIGGADRNSIHIIALTKPDPANLYNGLSGALTYSRSTDGGTSWDKKHIIIPGMDQTYYLGFASDCYAIDASGDTIAIVAGGPERDVVLVKSVDNGNTWTRTVVYKFPIAKFDGTKTKTDSNNDGKVDTLQTNDGCMEVLIGKNGNANVFYGKMYIYCTTPGTAAAQGARIITDTDSLMFWNESMGTKAPKSIAYVMDSNDDHKLNLPTQSGSTFPFGVYKVALTTHPSAGIDNDGNMYLAYSSILEREGSDFRTYRHTYVIKSGNNGTSWSAPLDISDDLFTECVYASLARNVDSHLHIVYQKDDNPGISIDPNGGTSPDYQENKNQSNSIVYSKISKDFAIGILNVKSSENLISVYPNPARNNTTIRFDSGTSAEAEITIFNMIGTKVVEFKAPKNMGQTKIDIDLTSFSKGAYFVRVYFGKGKISHSKLIVE